MRPDAPPDPAVETLEELSDVGAFVLLDPPSQERVSLLNQLLGFQRCRPFGSLPYPGPRNDEWTSPWVHPNKSSQDSRAARFRGARGAEVPLPDDPEPRIAPNDLD